MNTPLLKADTVRAERTDADWGHLSWLASAALGNVSDLTLGRVTIYQGHSNPRHCHPKCEEIIYVLSGSIEHTLGDESFHLEAGDTLAIPAGIFHNATTTGQTDADMIVAYSAGDRGFVLENP